MWEDDKNKKGGRWLMTLNKQQRHNDLDRFWLETVTAFHLYHALIVMLVNTLGIPGSGLLDNHLRYP